MGKILIVHTGGTLGMRPRHPDEALEPDEFGPTVLEHVPELARMADIETHVLCNLDSSDLGPTHWLGLANTIYDARDDYDGVVITHGTDAMAYTASALSYVLRDLPFPVIVTGSQRPLSDVHTDGRANLVGAVDLALRPIPEVCIYFDGLLMRGNRAVKYSTFNFGAFQSPNFPVLAEIGTEVRVTGEVLQPSREFRIVGSFDPRIAVVGLAPGNNGVALSALREADVRSVLLVAFGYGNIPVKNRSVADAIRGLVDAGKVVAVGTQSRHGATDMRRYAGGRLALASGAVGTADMTVPATTVKLMYLAASNDDADAIRAGLSTPIAGEISAPNG